MGTFETNYKKNNAKLNLIVCIDNDYSLGNQDNLIYRFKEDLAHFKNTTNGGVLILGSKTHFSMNNGKALPNRTHIVLTRNKESIEPQENVYVVSSKDEAIHLINKRFKDKQIFISGGNEIYKLFKDDVDTYIVTKVNEGEKDCDTYLDESVLKNMVVTKEKELIPNKLKIMYGNNSKKY